MGLYIPERRYTMITKKESRAGSIALGFICIAIPLVVGLVSARLAGDQMKTFGELNQPPLSPPAWLFPVVWTILYVMMGIVLLLIMRSHHEYKVGAVALFISQLIMNFLWSPAFFVERDYVKALVILLLMLTTTVILTLVTRKINRLAAIMLIPYIAWMCFATYLNAYIGILNQ